MLPRWHVILGLLFTIFLWIAAPETNLFYLLLVFLSSIFIDLDHYAHAVWNNKKLSLFHAFEYHKIRDKELRLLERKGLKPKTDFHLFHTIEFHLLIALFSIIWAPAFYLFVGMAFHSLLDLFYLLKSGKLYRREYFFFRWLQKQF